MHLKNLTKLSLITTLALSSLYAEDYVSVEFLQYNENDNRVAVSAPTLSLSYDIGTDFNIQANFVNDTVSGGTPVWQSDTSSGASGQVNNSSDYVYKNQNFTENRNAGSIILTRRFKNRDELHLGTDFSSESDYQSNSFSAEYMHYTDSSHNRSINAGISGTFNEIIARPIGATIVVNDDGGSGASQEQTSNSVNLQLGINQILNANSSIKLDAFAIFDAGYLTNPHGAVVRNYGTNSQKLVTENRPSKRTAYGIALKHITMLGSKISLASNYRYYSDDWNINSHTIEENLYYQWNKNLILGGGGRYYTQTASSFYNGEKNYFTNETYASSDERLSQFNALTYKANIDYKIKKDISYNLGAEFYSQSTGLKATIITTGVKYHF